MEFDRHDLVQHNAQISDRYRSKFSGDIRLPNKLQKDAIIEKFSETPGFAFSAEEHRERSRHLLRNCKYLRERLLQW